MTFTRGVFDVYLYTPVDGTKQVRGSLLGLRCDVSMWAEEVRYDQRKVD